MHVVLLHVKGVCSHSLFTISRAAQDKAFSLRRLTALRELVLTCSDASGTQGLVRLMRDAANLTALTSLQVGPQE